MKVTEKSIKIVEYNCNNYSKADIEMIFFEYSTIFDARDKQNIIDILKSSSSKTHIKYVAIIDSTLVGFISATHPSDSNNIWFLSILAVKKGFQGYGVGRALIKTIENYISTTMAKRIYIDTCESDSLENQNTKAFYLKMGYKEVGRIPNYYDLGEDIVYYYKELH